MAARKKTSDADDVQDAQASIKRFYDLRAKAYDEATIHGLERYLGEPATLSVYLAAPPPAADAATVTFSNVGPAIDIEKGGGSIGFHRSCNSCDRYDWDQR